VLPEEIYEIYSIDRLLPILCNRVWVFLVSQDSNDQWIYGLDVENTGLYLCGSEWAQALKYMGDHHRNPIYTPVEATAGNRIREMRDVRNSANSDEKDSHFDRVRENDQ